MPASVLDGRFSIEAAAGRNGAWLIRLSEETLLVKPFPSADSCDRETRNLIRAVALERGPRVPAIRSAEANVLVTATPSGLGPVGVRRPGRPFPRWQLDVLARSLSALHQVQADETDSTVGASFDPRLTDQETANDSSGVRALLRDLQKDDETLSAIDDLSRDLRAENAAVVHGDIRSANVLATVVGRQIWLIDWELAGRGHPSIDIGAVVAMLLEDGIRASGAGPDRQGVGRFLSSYGKHRVDLSRSLRCAGLRLLQAASEGAMYENEPSPYVRRLVDIGRIALTRAEEVAVQLRLVS